MKRFTAAVFATVIVAGAALVGSPGWAVDQSTCPHPAVSSITATPTSVIGGTANFHGVVTFAGVIPQGCTHFYRVSSSDAQVLNPAAGGGCASVSGDGTNQETLDWIAKVVDATKTATPRAQSRTGDICGGTNVGAEVSGPSLTVTPIALRSFSLDKATIRSGQSATGTITLEGQVHNLSGSAKVNISATPATAVQLPASINIGCCTSDGQGHSKKTFTVTGRTVSQNTQVTIRVNRPNQTAITRTITITP